MSPDAFIKILIEHWESVLGHLADDGRAVLRGLAEQFAAAAPGSDERLDAALDLADLLSTALPPGHPVRDAIDHGGVRLTAAPATDAGSLAAAIRARLRGAPLPRPGDPATGAASSAASGPAEPARSGAADRLLAAPAFTGAELLAHGADPGQRDLIRLPGSAGPRYPAFQFDRQGRPLRLVLEINAVLDAAHDPWGVADWWLGRNAWLAARPADLLGRAGDGILLDAARALVGED